MEVKTTPREKAIEIIGKVAVEELEKENIALIDKDQLAKLLNTLKKEQAR